MFFSHPQKWSEFWHFKKLSILALVCTHMEIFGFEVYYKYIIKYVWRQLSTIVEHLRSILIHFWCSKQFGAYCTSFSNKSARIFFYLNNFYIMKLISEPLTLRLLCSSRLRSNKTCLVDQLLLSQNQLQTVRYNSKLILN